ELLVVIAIIGILAAMLLPVINNARKKAQIKICRLEIGRIVTALHGYETDYSRYPASKEAVDKAVTANPAEDFTYGTTGLATANGSSMNPYGTGFSTPTGLQPINSLPLAGYQTNNSEIMAILMD